MQLREVKSFILKKLSRELPDTLSYHGVDHVKDVYKACQMLAKSEGIKGDDYKLLLTAALFHDSGFLFVQKDHEKRSCLIAREHLPAFGYNEAQLNRICGMIMATRIPQTPTNFLEEIICDADLDYLGRDDFFRIGNKLFAELAMYGILATEEDWNRLQIRFLESHHYFTPTSIKLRQGKKDAHLRLLRSKINKTSANETF